LQNSDTYNRRCAKRDSYGKQRDICTLTSLSPTTLHLNLLPPREHLEVPTDGNASENCAFSILAVINPCNPTGEYLNVQELKEYIKEQTDVGRINIRTDKN